MRGRSVLAWKEDLAMRGRGVLGPARCRSGSFHCGAARLAHLLLLEEEQKVQIPFLLPASFFVSTSFTNSFLTFLIFYSFTFCRRPSCPTNRHPNSTTLPVFLLHAYHISSLLTFPISFLSCFIYSPSARGFLVTLQMLPMFVVSLPTLLILSLVSLPGWSTSTRGWLYLPIRSVRCQERTAVP